MTDGILDFSMFLTCNNVGIQNSLSVDFESVIIDCNAQTLVRCKVYIMATLSYSVRCVCQEIAAIARYTGARVVLEIQTTNLQAEWNKVNTQTHNESAISLAFFSFFSAFFFFPLAML